MTEQEENEIAERVYARDRYKWLQGVFFTYPASPAESVQLAERIRSRMRVETMPDDVRNDIGLACRIVDAYAAAWNPKPPAA